MAANPSGRGCPRCGYRAFSRVASTQFFQFAYDRECDQCGTRYAVRVPRWAPVLCLFLGAVVVLLGLVMLVIAVIERSPGMWVRSPLIIAPGVAIIVWAVRARRAAPANEWTRANQVVSLPDPPPVLRDDEDDNRGGSHP